MRTNARRGSSACAEDLEQGGAALERHQHVPVDPEVVFAHRVEQARRAADVEALLGLE